MLTAWLAMDTVLLVVTLEHSFDFLLAAYFTADQLVQFLAASVVSTLLVAGARHGKKLLTLVVLNH